jgi:monodehydroascorbate reductase (NADH)
MIICPTLLHNSQVNEYLQTSAPDVYAVGDVAAFPLAREGGKLVRQEHVTHARASAAAAVQHILGCAGASTPYDYLPYFYSRVFNFSWQFWGSQGSDSARVLHFGDMAAGKPGAYWIEGGKVCVGV